jgi:4-amino-4-deoxy-L-arabinose transferase-like glycosyltransferase
VTALRLFDVLLGGATLVVGYLVASDILHSTLAMAVPLVMTGVPMFTAISASISADALANLLAALLLLVLVRALRAPRLATRHAAALGALLALGVLSKLALVIFIPLALAVMVYRAAQPARAVAALLVTGALVGLPWMVHQVTSYGLLDPLGTTRHALVTDQPRFPGLSPEYIGSFLRISFHSFWAQFGWMAILAPDRLYFLWGGVCLVALAGLVLGLMRAKKRRCWRADWILLLATIVGAWLAYIGYNLTFQQPQGRYLFTALTPLAICLVVGWAAWAPRRMRGLASLSLSLALLALNAYTLVRVLGPGFLGVTLS